MSAQTASYCQKTKPSKPDLPYVVERTLNLRSHMPPNPTSVELHLKPKTAQERKFVHPLAQCLFHLPLPGSDGQMTAEVKRIRPIRAGDNHKAQIVVVQVTSSSSPMLPTDVELVAKIYDPLYFNHDDDFTDPFFCVDNAYSHETAAYRKLSNLQGGILPKYFGSFTIQLPVNQKQEKKTRFVRLILLEVIPGRTIQQSLKANLLQRDRKDIMKATIDAESLIYKYDVVHMDFRPSNVLVCENGTKNRPVVIIDFGKCQLGRCPSNMSQKILLPGLYISPLLRWANPWEPFEGPWIDWNWRQWLENHYALTTSSITDHMRSIWTVEPPKHLIEPPRPIRPQSVKQSPGSDVE